MEKKIFFSLLQDPFTTVRFFIGIPTHKQTKYYQIEKEKNKEGNLYACPCFVQIQNQCDLYVKGKTVLLFLLLVFVFFFVFYHIPFY